MKALTWHGKHDVRCETVDDPEILNPRDAIIPITSTAICGSDLHLYDGYIPAMEKGDILGHELTIFGDAMALARHPGVVDACLAAGHEIAPGTEGQRRHTQTRKGEMVGPEIPAGFRIGFGHHHQPHALGGDGADFATFEAHGTVKHGVRVG